MVSRVRRTDAPPSLRFAQRHLPRFAVEDNKAQLPYGPTSTVVFITVAWYGSHVDSSQ